MEPFVKKTGFKEDKPLTKAGRLTKAIEFSKKESRNEPWNELQEDPTLLIVNWVWDVKRGNTWKGYWDWVIDNIKRPEKYKEESYSS
jgi:hypothetical protein